MGAGREKESLQDVLWETLWKHDSLIFAVFLEPSCVAKYILLSYTLANKGASQVSQCLRQQETGFDHWVGKIPWGRKWQPTPGFLPGEFHVQRSLVGYSLWGYKRVRHG